MKILKLIKKYRSGIRFPMVFLSLMMTVSVFITVYACSVVNFYFSDYNIITKNTVSGRCYYVALSDISIGNLSMIESQKRFADARDELKQNPAIEHIYTIKRTSLAMNKGDSKYSKTVDIVIYPPELIEAFPKLIPSGTSKKLAEDTFNCVIGSRKLNHIETGDKFTLYNNYLGSETTFTSVGHLNVPYRNMSFNGSGTTLTSNNIFTSGELIILRDSEALSECEPFKSISTDENYMIAFKKDADPAEKEKIVNSIAQSDYIASIEEMAEASKLENMSVVKRLLPVPLFALIITTVAYFSLMILIFKKKEGDIAIMYLCGGSKRKCCFLSFIVFSTVAFIPTVINLAVLLTAKRLDWNGIISLEEINLLPDNRMVILIVGYYIISSLLAVSVIIGSMSKQTPLTYLKGTEK